MAKTNWGSALKTIARVAFDALAAAQKNSPKRSGTSTSPKPASTRRKKAIRAGESSKINTDRSKKTHVNVDREPNSVRAGSTRAATPRVPATGQINDDSGYVSPPLTSAYPGDYSGAIHPEYAPNLDGDADPGEIVWTWVPFEEDYSQGKDRPVLVVGHDGEWLLGLMLTSKDHTSTGSRYGKWLDIGSGPWDAQGRDSEVRLDRAIRINPDAMRREGAVMDRELFVAVIKAMPFKKA